MPAEQPARPGGRRSPGPRQRGGSPGRASPGQRSPDRGRRPARGAGPDPARRAAFDVLRAVDTRDAYANLMLPALLRERHLHGRDAAFATELTYGTLRGLGTYDAVLAACSTRPLERVSPPVLDVLRLGAHQALATRVGAHAAVATSVDLAREVAGAPVAGFVNAVLRKVTAQDMETWVAQTAPDRGTDPLGHLAVRYSHPRWVVSVFAEALGEDGASGYPETEQALAADSLPPAVTLCVAPGHSDPERLPPARAVPARWSPFGRYLETGDPASLPAVRAGDAAVQDEANQLAVLALTRASLGQPDRRWLDLCAGPGGKARLLAWLAAAQGARLAAMDIRPHRAQLVAAATARTGAAATVVADGTVPPWRTEAFDRVIADAPCSGLGALRRRPEARWRKTPADVTAVGALQRRLLASALDAARPGGVVAYVTCSPHVQETRAVVEDTMASRGGVTVLDTPAVLSEVPDLACPDPGHAAKYAQFWPHRHGTDAIFVALLRRDR